MFLLLVLCAAVLAVPDRSPRLERSPVDIEGRNADYTPGERIKRAVPKLIGAVLNTAQLLGRGRSIRTYTKKGDSQQALHDFEAMGPKDVIDNKDSKWGKLDDNRVIMLKNEDGADTIEIWEYKHLPDGRSKRVGIDKIKYYTD